MSQSDAWTIRQKITGVLLRQARQEAGKTLKECGQVLGLSSSVLSAIERGQRGISLPELELLAYYLDVPVDRILNNGSIPTGPSPKEVPGQEVLALRHRIIGAQLRQARLTRDLTQAELAAEVGLPSSRLSDYEQGQRPIPLLELEALAKVLDVPITRFLDEGVGPIGQRQKLQKDWQQFSELPADLRDFVLDPINRGYLQLAIQLSSVPADGLRNIAASLLEITF